MEIFTDGSCLNNSKSKVGLSRGGIGVFIEDNDPRNISESLKCDKITNQVAELTAISKAIDIIIEANKPGINYIYTDSKYCIGIFTEWIKLWEKNNWKRSSGTIENLDLIKNINNKLKKTHVIFKHIRSHQSEPSKDDPKYKYWYGNQQADYLATQASKNN